MYTHNRICHPNFDQFSSRHRRKRRQKSKGPITPERKLASAQNSLKQGLLAAAITLDGECTERFTAQRNRPGREHGHVLLVSDAPVGHGKTRAESRNAQAIRANEPEDKLRPLPSPRTAPCSVFNELWANPNSKGTHWKQQQNTYETVRGKKHNFAKRTQAL